MSIDIVPATADRREDIEAVLDGRRGRDACWCQRFRDHACADNESAFERELATASPPIGLIAYRDGGPAGWSRVVPRRTLPGVLGNRALRGLLGDDVPESSWWIGCVVVHRAHRGHGVGTALVRAAVEFARRHGAVVLDGHPVDVHGSAAAVSGSRASASALFTGTLPMFRAAGFDEIGRTYPTRPVMRKTLA